MLWKLCGGTMVIAAAARLRRATKITDDYIMWGLEKYREIFGRPREGLHRFRIFDIAIIDVIMTLLGAFLLAWIFKWPVLYVAGALFLLAIFLHRIFGVRTTIDKIVAPDAPQ